MAVKLVCWPAVGGKAGVCTCDLWAEAELIGQSSRTICGWMQTVASSSVDSMKNTGTAKLNFIGK